MDNVSGENVAQPAQGFNQGGLMRIDLNFTPQAHDQHIDRAVEYLHALIMGQRQQLFAVQNPAGVLRQRQQQSILPLG